ELVPERLADMGVDRHQLGGRVVWLYAKAYHAVVGAVRGIGSEAGRCDGQCSNNNAARQGRPATMCTHVVPDSLRRARSSRWNAADDDRTVKVPLRNAAPLTGWGDGYRARDRRSTGQGPCVSGVNAIDQFDGTWQTEGGQPSAQGLDEAERLRYSATANP